MIKRYCLLRLSKKGQELKTNCEHEFLNQRNVRHKLKARGELVKSGQIGVSTATIRKDQLYEQTCVQTLPDGSVMEKISRTIFDKVFEEGRDASNVEDQLSSMELSEILYPIPMDIMYEGHGKDQMGNW